MTLSERVRKAADRLRLLAGQDSAGVGLPLRVDSVGRLEVVGVRSVVAVRVYKSAAFTHNASGSWLSIPFDSETYDTDGMHSTITNTTRITAIQTGTYIVGGSFAWAASAVGLRGISIRLDGATFLASTLVGNTAGAQGQVCVMGCQLSAGQYVELCAYQNSGGNLDISRTVDDSPVFWAVML